MLEIIKKLDAGTIKGLIVATVPLLALFATMFGVDQAVFDAQVGIWTERILAAVTLGGIAWAAWARLFQPTPPLTETAAQKTAAMAKSGKLKTTAEKQGGFIRAGVLGLLLAFSVVSAAVLPACTMIGVPEARTFNERLATGYSSVSAIRDTATTLLNGGQISSSDAENVQQQADNSRAALDIARTVSTTDMSAADAKLQATLAVLTALDTYLRSKS